MKQFSKALLGTAIVFTTSTAIAGYDDFDCRSNAQMEMSGLKCVSCGIQKYYQDQGQEVQVSDKWLALMGLLAQKQYNTNTVTSGEDREKFQMSVIKLVQAYGVCSEYLGKDTLKQGRSPEYHDMSAQDWRFINELLNRKQKVSDKQMETAAEMFGFDSFFWRRQDSKDSLDYLFDGAFDGQSTLDYKRDIFKEKLNQATIPDYNVSGEKIERPKDYIKKGDKDQGLRKCLADVKERFFKKQMTDKTSHKFCATIADACDLPRKNLSNMREDFCLRQGMALRPASATQPKPFGGSGSSSGGGKGPTPPGLSRPAGGTR
ncbi:hypothetical protein EZJ49_03210 [Bdellovibrio bacteriovorus]|uniref:hypothetical protein n=1 Tax=Bdellovibrio bacteriovorus TaxID=959 RepID=UPI0021D2C84C|nr:hypothetical protein [Bdellovibrio bacteriovorus]UXR65258.1 hypothetical protein EZJ49_03210 [Bdellovibrio bacteriovorus]